MLLRTFCELAANPQLQQSAYLAALFCKEVLGEWYVGEVPPSPYYNEEFFNILRHYHLNSTLNVATMTIRQRTLALTQDRVTHSPGLTCHPYLGSL